MASFDLDAARAARAEARGEPPTVTFGGEEYVMPAELELEAAEHLMFGRPTQFVKALLGEDWERFNANKPTLNDLKDLSDGLAVLYGFAEPGESPASPSSSTSNGNRSRPTSNGSTASRSPRRATAKSNGAVVAVSKPSSSASPKSPR